MRRTLGLALQGQSHDTLDCCVADLARSTRPWLIQQPIHPVIQKPTTPLANRSAGDLQALGDITIKTADGAAEDDPRTQRKGPVRSSVAPPSPRESAAHSLTGSD